MTHWSTEVRTDIGAFSELADWWDGQPAVADKPFLNSRVLSTWRSGIGEANSRLRLHLLSRNGELVAALPLYQARGRHRSIYRGYAEPFDVIAIPDEEVVEYLPKWIERLALVHLYRVPDTSPLVTAARRHSRWTVRQQFNRPYVDLTRGIEGVRQNMSAGRRKSQRRRRRRLEEMGEVRFVDHPSPGEVETLLEAGLRMEVESWKGERGDAVLKDENRYRWYRSLTEVLQEAGWLRLSALYLDDHLLAFNYGILYNGIRFGTVSSYDQSDEFRTYSAWNLMFESILELDAATGTKRYELGSGNDPYKYEWTQDRDVAYDLQVFGSGVVGRALSTLRGRKPR